CAWSALFFFSSRRRHTRFSRDWSSDVCSSDLVFTGFDEFLLHDMDVLLVGGRVRGMVPTGQHELEGRVQMISGKGKVLLPGLVEIGRASCRERAWIAVRGAALTQEDEAMTAGR